MKKEKKRYMLAEYYGYLRRTCNSKEEYDELIKKVNKFNSSTKNDKVYGNITYTIDDDNIYNVIINVYNKLTPKMTITELDDITFKFNNYSELVNEYKDSLKTNLEEKKPSVSIIYLEDKNAKDKTDYDADRGIKSINVLYKEDAKYFSKKYLLKCIEYYVNKNDYDFFLDMAHEFTQSRSVLDIVEEIRVVINDAKIKNINLKDTNILNITSRLYDNYIIERNKDYSALRDEDGKEEISRRRVRDFAYFVRNYHIRESKRYMPYMRFDFINHQEYDYISDNELEQMEEEQALAAWDEGVAFTR